MHLTARPTLPAEWKYQLPTPIAGSEATILAVILLRPNSMGQRPSAMEERNSGGVDGSRWASRTSTPLACVLRRARRVRLPCTPAKYNQAVSKEYSRRHDRSQHRHDFVFATHRIFKRLESRSLRDHLVALSIIICACLRLPEQLRHDIPGHTAVYHQRSASYIS